MTQFSSSDFRRDVAEEMLRYAGFLARRGWVYNTLGNIAIRVSHPIDPQHGVIYVKHKGISLEEMTIENIVVVDIDGNMLYGNRKPSIGNQLNREVFRCRPDINGIIHLHVNEVVSYFSVMETKKVPYISDDTALVLAKHVHVLDPNVNVEKDISTVKEFIHDTNCFVMPNHGVTTLGRHLSEAYHRFTSFVAEIQRLIFAIELAKATGKQVNYISEEDIKALHEWGEEIIYKDE